ncbi:hypothetical protein Tco_1074553 [Tanacetum coccineum]
MLTPVEILEMLCEYLSAATIAGLEPLSLMHGGIRLCTTNNPRACIRLRVSCQKLKKVLSANKESSKLKKAKAHVNFLEDKPNVPGIGYAWITNTSADTQEKDSSTSDTDDDDGVHIYVPNLPSVSPTLSSPQQKQPVIPSDDQASHDELQRLMDQEKNAKANARHTREEPLESQGSAVHKTTSDFCLSIADSYDIIKLTSVAPGLVKLLKNEFSLSDLEVVLINPNNGESMK